MGPASIGDGRVPSANDVSIGDGGGAAVVGSSARGAIGTLVFVLVLQGTAANAQVASSEPPHRAPVFVSNYDFHISLEAISNADPRFSWIGRVGGDFDLIDLGWGRLNLLAHYEVITGDEFRPFDTNQGNYTLQASVAFPVRGNDLSLVFHHVSRHLADRPKRASVAWNVLGVHVRRRFVRDATALDIGAGLGSMVQHSSVDYAWKADAGARIAQGVRRWLHLFADGSVGWFGIDETRSSRPTQWNGRTHRWTRWRRRGVPGLRPSRRRVSDRDRPASMAHGRCSHRRGLMAAFTGAAIMRGWLRIPPRASLGPFRRYQWLIPRP